MLLRSNSQFLSHSSDKYASSRLRSNSISSIKLGLIKSWKFTYKSPSKFQEIKQNPATPINFAKGFKKITYRRLPRFHQSILENDPEKTSKIIENINCLRQSKTRSVSLTTSRFISLGNSQSLKNSFNLNQSRYQNCKNQSMTEKKNHNQLMTMVQSHVRGIIKEQRLTQSTTRINMSSVCSLTDSRYYFSPKK